MVASSNFDGPSTALAPQYRQVDIVTSGRNKAVSLAVLFVTAS